MLRANKTKKYKQPLRSQTAILAVLFSAALFSIITACSLFLVKNLSQDAVIVAEASADDKVRAAEERVKSAEAEKKRIDEEKKAREQDRSQLAQDRRNLQNALDDLDAEMAEISLNIARLESDIIKKEVEIDDAELDLLEAVSIREQQYDDMKRRLKYTYERPEFLMIETMLSASSLSEFLNYADYFEQLAEYDQMKFDEFVATEEMIIGIKNQLIDDKEELDILLVGVELEQTRVSELIRTTSTRISTTSAQISEAEEALLEKERELKRKAEEIEELKKILAEEIRLRELAKQMAWRNISDITFAEGDRYLLANIIYCEAGGEPYNGQVAVGAVVINRMLSPVFPDTMVGVIYQNRQFSPVASGRLALALAENKATASCYRAADEAMAGASPVGNCLFFRTPIAGVTGQNIGGHVFY